MSTRYRSTHATEPTSRPWFARQKPTAPRSTMAKPAQERAGGYGSFRTSASKIAQGIGTTDRITMNVSTLEALTTALPAVIVMKNMPAAGKNCLRRSHSSGSTSSKPTRPAAQVTAAANVNCNVVRVHTKGNSLSAHLLMTSKHEAQVAWPRTSISARDELVTGGTEAGGCTTFTPWPASIATRESWHILRGGVGRARGTQGCVSLGSG
mmetsp:Transcript_67756/g.207620  ORF Transcript_67756/g.207620 Transcript_67756/m.207620 type:complete len:209 (+) Transcript_67756:397-1023(+)